MPNSPFIWGSGAAHSLQPGVKLPGSTSGLLTIEPAATTTSHTLTLPAAQGAVNTVLTNNGSGALSWASASGLQALSTKTTTYSVATTDGVLLLDATSAAFTTTLPTAVGNTGKIFYFKKIDSTANLCTIATTSSQTIDGVLTIRMGTQYDELVVVSNGTNWSVLAYDINTSARYVASGSTTIAASGVTTNINFATSVEDRLAMVTTGASWKCTFPFPGLYSFRAGVGFDTPGGSVLTRLLSFKNGSGTAYSFTQCAVTGAGEAAYMVLADTMRVVATDYIEIRASNSNASTTTTTSTNAATAVFVAIERIGN